VAFTIMDVDCGFLLCCPEDEPGLIGDRRLFDPTTGLSHAMRGNNYVKRSKLPNPVPGIVVGFKTTKKPVMDNAMDAARYIAANRPDFEVFNYVYKVYQPCFPGLPVGSLLPEDFEDAKREKIFKRKVGMMRGITVSLSANQVGGAIPPGTFVKVKYKNILLATKPQIVEIGEKIFDIKNSQAPPPGNKFILGTAHGPAGIMGSGGTDPKTGKPYGGPTPDVPQGWTGDSARWPQSKKLDSLADAFRPKAQNVIQALSNRQGTDGENFQPKIFFGWRSEEVQRELYEKGTSKVLFSFHNATLGGQPNAYAVDIIDKRHGWADSAAAIGFWEALGEEARAEGLVWGGDWTGFKDLAHIQHHPNNQLAAVKQETRDSAVVV